MDKNKMNSPLEAGEEHDDFVQAWQEVPDPLLSELSRQSSIFGVGITLLMPGMILEGQLMPINRWGELNLKEIKPALSKFAHSLPKPEGNEDDGNDLESKLHAFVERQLGISEEEVLQNKHPHRFLHLRDVSISPVGSGMSQVRPFMRVPTAQVVGWAFGTESAE